MSGQHRPKAELHVHLEGSIEPLTLMEIDPSLTPDEIETRTACSSFAEFLQAYIWVNKKLEKPEHYATATRHLLERLAAQNVGYAEITLSAGVVLWKGQDLAAVYDAIWRESLRSKVEVRWIPDAIRHFGAEPAMEVARFAVSRANDGVVAFGIGGDEVRGPAEWFKDVFAFARDGGLHLVCHAGETAGPESVWAALEIGAERIGHGIAAVHDAALMNHLRERKTMLEICITSNVCTGVVPSVEVHPARALYEAGVPITLNTDDPALFRTSLNREFEIAASRLGFSEAELEHLAENAFRYAFGDTTALRDAHV
ncbi:MAG TPA: adenosine deaminase [Bryobacteraceae bacterium]|nr:adenosine deaminase [Bryobacteraceae bacterium]